MTLLFTLLKNNLSRRRHSEPQRALDNANLVSTGCAPESLLSCIKSLDLNTRNLISVKGEHIWLK